MTVRTQKRPALTTRQVAELLDLNPATVWAHAKANKIPGAFQPTGPGGPWRFDPDIFDAWLESIRNPDPWAFAPGARAT